MQKSRYLVCDTLFCRDEDIVKNQIICRLRDMRASDALVSRIQSCMVQMSDQVQLKGALKFLAQLKNFKGLDEAIFSDYFSAISRLGLFAVGLYCDNFLKLLIATFAALNQDIPHQNFFNVKTNDVMEVIENLMLYCKPSKNAPEIFGWCYGASKVNVLGMVISKDYLHKVSGSLCFVLQLAAAQALLKIEQTNVDLSSEEIKVIRLAVLEKKVPAFLLQQFEYINKLIELDKSTVNMGF